MHSIMLAISIMLFSCLVYPSSWNMEAICFSETLLGFRRTTRRYIPANRTVCHITTAVRNSIATQLNSLFLLASVDFSVLRIWRRIIICVAAVLTIEDTSSRMLLFFNISLRRSLAPCSLMLSSSKCWVMAVQRPKSHISTHSAHNSYLKSLYLHHIW
jgi:hypothetical protein